MGSQGLRLRRHIICDNWGHRKTIFKVPNKWSMHTQIDGEAKCLASLKWHRAGAVTFPESFRHATAIMLTIDAKEDVSQKKQWKAGNEKYCIRLDGDDGTKSELIGNWERQLLRLEDFGFDSFDQVRKIKIRHLATSKGPTTARLRPCR